MKTLFISSYPPFECGIANFTCDLRNSISTMNDSYVVAVSPTSNREITYGDEVVATIDANNEADYRHAKNVIKSLKPDFISLQYEYGIYGGAENEHIFDMLKDIDVPVITTLHTVLEHPNIYEFTAMLRLAEVSMRIIVMNELAIEILNDVYGIDSKMVSFVHHGAPTPINKGRSNCKATLKIPNNKVISTFGLMSSGKGIEDAVSAMSYVVKTHPEVLYLVLGETHPVIKEREGERYRESLMEMVEGMGLSDNVKFVNKYFTPREIILYLMASDMYLTPYLNLEQVTSGTLAYAVCCGRAVISTPYLHAKFLLADGRGMLVNPHDPKSLGESILYLLNNPEKLREMEQRAYHYGKNILWSNVAKEFMNVCTCNEDNKRLWKKTA